MSVPILSFHLFKYPNKEITPNISTISPSFQYLYNSVLIFSSTAFGTYEAAKLKSKAARSASEKAACVLYSQILSNCSCSAP